MEKGTLIIGNGIAGITAARHLRKLSDQRIRVISKEAPYFFARTALMYVYMGHLRFEHTKPYADWFWKKNRIERIQACVNRVNPDNKNVILDSGEILEYDSLVLATGSKTKYYDWKGQDAEGVQGLVSYQDLEKLEANTPEPFQENHPTKKAIIIGAGLIGVEMAEMLNTRAINVTMLVRQDRFWAEVLSRNEAELIGNHIESHGVRLQYNTELDEVIANSQNRVCGIRTAAGKNMDCQLLGIATGVTPNIDFLRTSGLEIESGICVNSFLETNLPNIYAIGDCAEIKSPVSGRKPIEAVWYVGRMMGEVLGRTLSGKRTAYLPGPWFNSAKFFDIEFQTYGNVNPIPNQNQSHFFWKCNSRQFMTIAYHPDTEEFQGINTFGIRLSHVYFDNVLKRKLRVGEVLGGIKAANFDPEFYRKWAKSLISDFENKTGIQTHTPSFFKKLLVRT